MGLTLVPDKLLSCQTQMLAHKPICCDSNKTGLSSANNDAIQSLACCTQALADDREREELYTEFMKERDRKEREEKKKERRRRMTAFKELLEQTSGIKVRHGCLLC